MVLLVALMAFTLRVYHLDAQSLWWDEAFSIALSEKGLAQITTGDFHPPLYHYLLHFWLGQAGETEFAARFLSVLCGTLMVPLVYQLGRWLFDRRTGTIGALLVALSPVHLWYSQEARMYILQALEYLALLCLFHRLSDDRRQTRDDRRWWIALVGVEVAGLYTHYFAAAGIIYLTAAVLISAAAGRCWRFAARWMGAQLLVALAYLPWLPVALPQMAIYKPEGAQAPALWEFVWEVWHFFNSGTLSLAAYHPTFTKLSSLTAGLFAVLVLILWWWDPRRRGSLQLLAHSAVPLALIFLLMQLRPGFHPRYVVMLATPVLLLVGRGTSLLSQGETLEKTPKVSETFRVFRISLSQLAALGLASVFLATFAVALAATATDPRFQREDVRALARHLERGAGPQDLILFGYEDYAFRYYYRRGDTARVAPTRGAAAVASLDLTVSDEQVAARLADLAAGHKKIWLVTWDQAPVDKRGILPWLLERSGQVVDHWYSPGLRAEAYRLEGIPMLPALERTAADFGPVTLTESFYEPAPAGEAIPLALRWRSAGRTDDRRPPTADRPLSTVSSPRPAVAYKATVVLQDQRGRRIASKDLLLLDQRGRSTVDWLPGTEAVNYYLLALPVGTPPVSYELRVGVYEADTLKDLDLRDAAGAPAGQRFALGSVVVMRSETVPEDAPLGAGYTAVGQPVADGLVLQGYVLDWPAGRAEQTLGVALRWVATRANLADYSPVLRLVQQDRVVAEAAGRPVYGTYPTTRWAPGEIVVDWRDLAVAPDALKGVAVLELALGQSVITLAEIPIEAPERRFSVPPVGHPMDVSLGGIARLLGYDLGRTRVAAGGTVPLTLYWQAINDGTVNVSYTVFTHLLSEDGRLIAQHDGPPARGTRATTSWVKGEVIADTHNMVFTVPDYRGEARIEVGLYNLATMTRLTTPGGEDRILLPTVVEVVDR